MKRFFVAFLCACIFGGRQVNAGCENVSFVNADKATSTCLECIANICTKALCKTGYVFHEGGNAHGYTGTTDDHGSYPLWKAGCYPIGSCFDYNKTGVDASGKTYACIKMGMTAYSNSYYNRCAVSPGGQPERFYKNSKLCCDNGYKYQNGKCLPCPTGCLSCSGNDTCFLCDNGYFLNSGNCIKCPDHAEICSGNTLACEDGYKKEENTCVADMNQINGNCPTGLKKSDDGCCCLK